MRKQIIFSTVVLVLILSVIANVKLAHPAVQGRLKVGVCYSNTASTFINKDRALMQEAGIKALRLSFDPRSLSNLQKLVPAVINSNMEVIGMLYNRDMLDTNNINGWSNYVYNTILSYKNYVKNWEIWNEPDWNTGFAPDGQVGDVAKYAQWLKAAYTNAKKADPTCNVIGGSLSVVQDNTLTWLGRLYDNGAQPYMDSLSIHPYSNTSPLPPAITSGGKAFWRAQDARNMMVQRGGENKRVLITELGWRTSGSGIVVTENVQAQYIKDALTYAQTNWSWLDTFLIYQWQDGGGFYFGLLRSDYSKKPSFYAVKEFNSQTSSVPEPAPPPVPEPLPEPAPAPTSTTNAVVSSITWNPSRYVDVVENIKYTLLRDGNVVWTSSTIARIPTSGTAVSPAVKISVPNVAADTLKLTVTDVELTGHTISINDATTLGQVQVGGDKKTFTQTFTIPQQSTPAPAPTPAPTQTTITSITWNPSRYVDVVTNIKYTLLRDGNVVWTSSTIARIPTSGTAVSAPVRTTVPNIVASELRLTVTDVELTGHTIIINEGVTVGQVQVGGDQKTFTQTFTIPPP